MHEHGLAKELFPQLKQIADALGLEKVTRVEMIVGLLHGVAADFLAHSFEHAFEGTNFEGAAVEITIVDPGQTFTPPDADAPTEATGWELLVSRIEGPQKPWQ